MKFHLRHLPIIVILFIFFLSVSGCGSNVTGEVRDKYSGEYIKNAKVYATTRTNIAEDKKYENKFSHTNSAGKFTIKGLSPKYYYTIRVEKEGYFSLDGSATSVSPPENGKTKIIENTFTLIKKITSSGKVIDRFKSNPISGSTIFAKSKIKNDNYDSMALLKASSDNNGSFEIGPFIPNSEYLVGAVKDGFCGHYYSFKNPGNISILDKPSYLIKQPDEFGVYLAKKGNNYEYEKLEPFNADFKKVEMKVRIGSAGYTSPTRYYVSEKEIQLAKSANADNSTYLILYFNSEVLDKNELLIVPFKFYSKLPIDFQERNWKEHDIDYLKENNVYLYAKSNEDTMPNSWREIEISSLSPETFSSESGDKKVYIVSISDLENGTYVFSLSHKEQWLFTKS